MTESTFTNPKETPTDEPTGKVRLGRFEIREKVGRGGMGTVFRAYDPENDREVALKVLPKDKASIPRLVKRFKAEAESASKLRHENITNVYEAGSADGYLFIVLEFVEGVNIQHLVRDYGVLTIRRSIEILKPMLHALDHAWQIGIVHRDIKPSNILVQPDSVVKLTDMGLARSIDDAEDAGLTREGTTVGTVDYISPEQAKDSKSADIRSDIYSLGCSWFFMLTGHPPFPEGSFANKIYAHISEKRPDPRKYNDSIPAKVVAVLHRMMAISPESRFQTPAQVISALDELIVPQDPTEEEFLELISNAAVTQPETGRTMSSRPDVSQAKRTGMKTTRGRTVDSKFSRETLTVFISSACLVSLLFFIVLWLIQGPDSPAPLLDSNPFR